MADPSHITRTFLDDSLNKIIQQSRLSARLERNYIFLVIDITFVVANGWSLIEEALDTNVVTPWWFVEKR